MRAAATGSTEPERLRQLSGVARHIANDGKPVTKRHHFVDIAEIVCFREATKTCADHFRDVTKLFLCGVHLGDVTEMEVCSACHDILLTVPECLPHFQLESAQKAVRLDSVYNQKRNNSYSSRNFKRKNSIDYIISRLYSFIVYSDNCIAINIRFAKKILFIIAPCANRSSYPFNCGNCESVLKYMRVCYNKLQVYKH